VALAADGGHPLAEQIGAGDASDRLRAVVLDQIPAFVGLLDADGNWQWLSSQGMQTLSYPQDQPPVEVLELVHPDDRAGLVRQLSDPPAGSAPFTLRVRHRDGGYRSLRTVVRDLRDEPAVQGLVIYGLDEPAGRGEPGEPGLARMISHELRTPLTSVVSFAELLAESLDGTSDPAVAEYVEVIERNARRLIRLVEDLRLIASLEWEDEPLRLASVDTGQLARDALRHRAAYSERKGLDLVGDEVEDGLRSEVDRERMAQVLDNVVGNAVKYTPAGGRVSLRSRREGAQWALDVADTGIGIPVAEQDRIFHDVFRASNTRTEGIPGTGMGLLISRVIVSRHGGQITMSSELGVGTTIGIRIPLWQAR